jgi:replicative DNA helicase
MRARRKETTTGWSYADKFGEEFQEHLLAVALRHPTFVKRFRAALDHRYFSAKICSAVAQALFEYVDEHGSLPTQHTMGACVREVVDAKRLTAVERLLGKLYEHDITDAEGVMKLTVEFGQTQAACNAVAQAIDDIDRGEREKIVPRLQKALQVGEDLLELGLNYKESFELRKTWYHNPTEFRDPIPTGIAHLDVALQGGLGRGEIGSVIAPPGRGKSTVLFNFAYGAMISPLLLRGYNVAYYSLEMAARKVTRRIDDRVAGNLLRTQSDFTVEKYLEVLERKMRWLRGNLIVSAWPTRSAGIGRIRSNLSLLKAHGFVPDVVIVDYADIMKPERRIGDSWQEAAGVYEDLRQLAQEFNVACWTASQIIGEGWDSDEVRLRWIAGAREKAAIADAAIGFAQTDEEFVNGYGRLQLLKFRDEEDHRTILCDIDRKRCRVRSRLLMDMARRPIEHPWDVDDERTRMILQHYALADERKRNRTRRRPDVPRKELKRK